MHCVGQGEFHSVGKELCELYSGMKTQPNNTGILQFIVRKGRSQWSRSLRRGSTAARLLRSWVRIPPEVWMFVCYVCVGCCQVEVSATSWSLVQKSPTDCGASFCVIKKPRDTRRPLPALDCRARDDYDDDDDDDNNNNNNSNNGRSCLIVSAFSSPSTTTNPIQSPFFNL
jgi:hypothetical protein